MSKVEQITRLQDRVDELMMQFSQDREPGGYYGLRLVRECLRLSYDGATDDLEGVREKLHGVELALDDFENFVVAGAELDEM